MTEPRPIRAGGGQGNRLVPLVAGIAVPVVAVLLCSCRGPTPVPDEAPARLVLASADLGVLATLHPAWGQIQAIRQELGAQGGVEHAIIEELALREVNGMDDPSHAAGQLPDSQGPSPTTPVTPDYGPSLESVLDRHYRQSPRHPGLRTPDDDVSMAKQTRPAPPAQAWASSVESEISQRMETAYEAELGAGAVRDPSVSQHDLSRLIRLLELEAQAAEARARAEWRGSGQPAESAPDGQPRHPESVTTAPDQPNVDLIVAKELRLREIAHDLAAETNSAEEFRRSIEEAIEKQSPKQPSWEDLAVGNEPVPVDSVDVGDPLPAERAELVRRYVALLETIAEMTRRDAVTVARSAGLDLRFDGQGPDRTSLVAGLLSEFYGHAGTPRRGPGVASGP